MSRVTKITMMDTFIRLYNLNIQIRLLLDLNMSLFLHELIRAFYFVLINSHLLSVNYNYSRQSYFCIDEVDFSPLSIASYAFNTDENFFLREVLVSRVYLKHKINYGYLSFVALHMCEHHTQIFRPIIFCSHKSKKRPSHHTQQNTTAIPLSPTPSPD